MIARTLTKLALLGALGAISTAACSSSPTPGPSVDAEGDANDMDARVPLSALSLGATPAPASACTVSSTGDLRKISFSSSLDCRAQAGAPGACTTADHLLLRVTSQLDATSDGSSTTWTITRGTKLVLSTASVWGDGFVTTDVTYGPEFVGVQKATFREDGKTLAGSVNGRAIVPMALDKLNPRQKFLFADHTVIPQATTSNPDTFAEVARLLKKASAEASSACVVTGGIRAPDAAVKRAASRLSTVLWRSGAVTPPTGGGTSMARKGPDQGAEGSARARAEGASAKEVVANDAPPAVPGTIANSPAVNDRTRQNDLLDWTTPECTHCEAEVASTWYCWGPQLPLCEADCFIPGHGCAENICPISSGIGSCDTGHECCGSRCCGGAEVCGSTTSGSNVSYSQGYCCPKEFPVACGDMTAASCFPAGTKCCGNLRKGCTADTVCTHVTALSATCCAPSHIAKDGSCCDVPTVDGVCCPAGQNVCNGATAPAAMEPAAATAAAPRGGPARRKGPAAATGRTRAARSAARPARRARIPPRRAAPPPRSSSSGIHSRAPEARGTSHAARSRASTSTGAARSPSAGPASRRAGRSRSRSRSPRRRPFRPSPPPWTPRAPSSRRSP